MKSLSRWILLLILLLLVGLAVPTTALAQDRSGDEFVFGGVFTLDEGDRLRGNLYVFGGVATVEEKARVSGDVIVFGGALDIAGEVEGDITIMGGNVELRETAVVEGDVNSVGGSITPAEGAVIEGDFNEGLNAPFAIFTPSVGPRTIDRDIKVDFNPIVDFLWFMFRTFLWAALAIVAVLFLPRQTERTANAALAQPLISIGVGLLTIIVVPIVLIILLITIIGIPVSLLGMLALFIIWALGIVSLGTELGRRLAVLLKQDWALPVSAGLGTFILIFLANGIGQAVPCVGWLVPLALGLLGVGAVLLTRFGTQDYPPVYPPAPGSPVGPAPYGPPPGTPGYPAPGSHGPAGSPRIVVPDIPPHPEGKPFPGDTEASAPEAGAEKDDDASRGAQVF